MGTRNSVKVVFLCLASLVWLSCEEGHDPEQMYPDDMSSRASVVGTYQAEARSFESGCKMMTNNSGFTGTGFMDYGSRGSLVEWNNIKVSSAGEYTLRFRYANGSRGDRRCALTVNGSSKGSVRFAPTGNWTTWKNATIEVSLKAGANNIRVTADPGAGPNLDKVDVLSEESDDSGTVSGRCVEVTENSSDWLKCTGGGVITKINFASYGIPGGSCATGFTTGTCHSSTSKSELEARCLNKTTCSVEAKNGTFGDPCPGKRKKLAVTYTCSDTETGIAARDFVGYFERKPVLNDWHKVNITLENNRLWWKNAAGVRWSLSYTGGVLKSGSDCPYGARVIDVEEQSGSDRIKSLTFNGERYVKGGDDTTNDQCPDDPNKTEPGECGCGVPEGQCSGGCEQGCQAPTPICGPNNKCTSTRWVEPISTLPSKWKSQIDTKVWTKWVRSVIPVIGQRSTKDAALLEVAYFAERIHMPSGKILVPDLINSMLGPRPTRFSVYPACPKAYMHPAVKPTMSSGGGGWTNTLVSEDWILRYPKCTGRYAVACDQIPEGVLCNNCQWQNASQPETCRDTLAHEHGHTCDLHRRNYLDKSVDAEAKKVFSYNDTEGPAWAASKYFMNPSLETNTGRDRGKYIMSAQDKNYWSVTHKFNMSHYPAGWGYVLKTTRCPNKGLTEPCPDTLKRTYSVPLDSM